jgi:hypothetical protein
VEAKRFEVGSIVHFSEATGIIIINFELRAENSRTSTNKTTIGRFDSEARSDR